MASLVASAHRGTFSVHKENERHSAHLLLYSHPSLGTSPDNALCFRDCNGKLNTSATLINKKWLQYVFFFLAKPSSPHVLIPLLIGCSYHPSIHPESQICDINCIDLCLKSFQHTNFNTKLAKKIPTEQEKTSYICLQQRFRGILMIVTIILLSF